MQDIEQAIERVKSIFEQLTGTPAQAAGGETYARIPPEADPGEHVVAKARELYLLVDRLARTGALNRNNSLNKEPTMTNDVNVQQKLQVLNDYIQRTIDTLQELSNNTRVLSQNLGVNNNVVGQNVVQTGGYSHSSVNNVVPQVVGVLQTPYGVFQVPVSFVPVVVDQTQVGLSHSAVVPQVGVQGVVQGVVPQVGVQGVQGVQGVVQGVVPQHVVQGVVPQVVQQVRGIGHSTFVPVQGVVQGVVPQVGVQGVQGVVQNVVPQVGVQVGVPQVGWVR